MKRSWAVMGVLLILGGSVFALQGLNVLLGSFMSGRTEWLIIGAAMVVVGAGVLVVGSRGTRAG